jgi:hypothetical protein
MAATIAAYIPRILSSSLKKGTMTEISGQCSAAKDAS